MHDSANGSKNLACDRDATRLVIVMIMIMIMDTESESLTQKISKRFADIASDAQLVAECLSR
jgi:hypothetical protein